MTSFPLPGRVVFLILICLVPAAVAYAVLLFVAGVRRSRLWLVPGWLAAAALAPVAATFAGVRMVIKAFEGLSTGGGGIGAISAGMWEATQPLIYGSYLACGLSAVTFFIAIHGVVNRDEEEASVSSPKAAILAALILCLTFAALTSTSMLFRDMSGIIIDVADPRLPQTIPLAEVSQRVASGLIRTAATAVGMILVLLSALVITAVFDPKQEPPARFASTLVFVSAIAVVVTLSLALSHRYWAAKLLESAMTGQFQR